LIEEKKIRKKTVNGVKGHTRNKLDRFAKRHEVGLLGQGMCVVSVVYCLVLMLRAADLEGHIALWRPSGLTQSSGVHDMAESAAFNVANTLVSKIRAFESVSLRAFCAFPTVSETSKSLADRSVYVNMYMSIPAIILVTVAILKVDAGRRALGRGFMRQRAGTAVRTIALGQELPADGRFVGVMIIPASWTLTNTYSCVSEYHRERTDLRFRFWTPFVRLPVAVKAGQGFIVCLGTT
jgi:hypothetical protein